MELYEIQEKLRKLPENQRTQYAKEHLGQVRYLDHETSFFMELLPKLDRVEVITPHLNKIDNPVVFAKVVATLPQEQRLEFARQHYPSMPLQSRRDAQALGSVIRQLPETDRLDFALHHADEIEGVSDWLLQSVVKELPPASRLAFVERFLPTVFLHAASTVTIMELLEEKDRLPFFLRSKGTYLTFNEFHYACNLIPADDQEAFLEINTEKMLRTFEISEPIRHVLTEGVYHPIYYSLQRAFIAIEHDLQDEMQKAHIYAKISYFFNRYYATYSRPYNPETDNQYIYLRELEAKAVATLVKRAKPDFSSSIIDAITQYSGHHLDPQQCQARTLELESLPQDELTWGDLVYLHKNTLGLRGVTDDDMAIREASHNGHGDAVSLACFGMGEEEIRASRIFVNGRIAINEPFPQRKAELIKALQEGMKSHIQKCFYHGYSVAFELVSRGEDALCPYDFHSYPLGKCGSKSFNASQVKTIILRQDCPTWNVDSVYRFVVAEIKKLKAKQEPAAAAAAVVEQPEAQYNPAFFGPEPVAERQQCLNLRCVIM